MKQWYLTSYLFTPGVPFKWEPNPSRLKNKLFPHKLPWTTLSAPCFVAFETVGVLHKSIWSLKCL